MQGRHEYQPELFSQIDMEVLIPKGHLLRRIDRVLDLKFLPALTESLYSPGQGRPSIDPVIFIRMVLLGYLYNIDSDRQLCEEVGYNLAYRWFCRLSLKDSVPDHSSITRIRDRLGEKVYEQIFNEVVEQCRKAGLVKLEQVMVDGSHIKANASIYKMQEREKKNDNDDEPMDPPASSAHAHSKDGLSVNDFRKRGIGGKKISNKTYFSPADPEATLSGKAGESKALAFKTHHAIDASSRVIIDCHVTTGSVSDVTVFTDRINHIQEKFEQKIGEVIADRGYGSAENLEELKKQEIKSNIPLWSSRVGETFFKGLEDGFTVDHEASTVHCPEGHMMKFSCHDESGHRDIYVLPRKTCMSCPKAKSCLTGYDFKTRGKRFGVPNHYQLFSEVTENQKKPEFRKKLWERMWKMEGIFAEAKSHHGMRRARYRGRSKMQIQVYMTSTVQNLKRLVGAFFDDLILILLQVMGVQKKPIFCRKVSLTLVI
jgi:transposase